MKIIITKFEKVAPLIIMPLNVCGRGEITESQIDDILKLIEAHMTNHTMPNKSTPKFKVGDLVISPFTLYGYEVVIHGQVISVHEVENVDGIGYKYEVRILKDGAITGDSDMFDEHELKLDK